jgi:adenylate cyclase class IV
MAKNPNHREMEIKLAADEVDATEFNAFCFAKAPSKYMHVFGPDTYYVQGKNVLRHRKNGEGAGELTVKRRTSKKSTRDRLEIDLRFSDATTPDDVERFLGATGWKPQFTVVKDCHIFWFEDRVPHMEVVLYDVRAIFPNGKETPNRRFIEVEVHKAHSGHLRGLSALKDWERQVRKEFRMGETMGSSLYELYSGTQYQMVKR